MPPRKKAPRRPPGKGYHRRSNRSSGRTSDRPRVDGQLKSIFGQIGVPESAPIKPDPFQLEALDKIKDHDILVSAPTGAGKTWIASRAIEQMLSREMRTWYASPLKALSNSLYNEFRREFGPQKVGILTGDRKENPDARIIVGTTEILRNQLYDAMHQNVNIQTDLVILDEAHYLSDPDRGVVWEEVLIYLPSRVRLLLLSATIPNAEEICEWLEENREISNYVVRAHKRPVPLEMLFFLPDGEIVPLGGKRGLTAKVSKFLSTHTGRGGRPRGYKKVDFGYVIKCLREFNLLPAIFFLKSRADCDSALFSCVPAKGKTEIKERLKNEVQAYLEAFPHLENHRQIGFLTESLVASHHAGQLPYWKMLIERMMIRGYLEAIFSTSTVAAGVNFPARTVALVQSDRYDGREFIDLSSTDLHQMIGRAGRRGKDNIGFALIIPGLHQDPQLIHELRDAPPDSLKSQIHINFSMTLNLLLSHRPTEVKDLLDRSFAAFQQRGAGMDVKRKWDEMILALNQAIPKGRCDIHDPYEVLENIRRRSELEKEARELSKQLENKRLQVALEEYLQPGRLFLHRDGKIYLLFHTYMDHGRFICAAYGLNSTIRMRRGRIRLKKIPLKKVLVIYDYRVSLPDDQSINSILKLIEAIEVNSLEVLNIPNLDEEESPEELRNIQQRLKELPCETCDHLGECHAAKNKELKRVLKDFRSLAYSMEDVGEGLWLNFKRHLRFLKETGFVDDKDRLTLDGIWASKLRLDHPLLIAEAIRRGGFRGDSPEIMAGCIAPFVWDRLQDIELNLEEDTELVPIAEAFNQVIKSMGDIRKLKVKRGFINPPILLWPAITLYLWAKMTPWNELIKFVRVDEGDISSMIIRTADHLRQVANLSATHPELASTARLAIDLIMREPVFLE